MTGHPEDLVDFLARRRDALEFDLAFKAPLAQWQGALRDVWLNSLPNRAGAPDVEASEARSSAGLAMRQLRFRYATGDSGEAALLFPPHVSGPLPAVVLLHDHGGSFDAGWRKMIADGVAPASFYEGRHLGNDLAAAGYAVLCIDAFGWGSRFYGGYDHQQAVAYHALQLGWSLAGIVAADDLQSIAWLAQQPEIDPLRIAVMGFSMGGYRAWQAAALSQHVAATVSISWLGCRKDMLNHANPLLRGHSANYFLHPALATRADYPDMIGLAADRALFIRAGDEDRHMPKATMERALEKVGMISREGQGVLDAGIFCGGHHCPRSVQEEALAFLGTHL